MAICQPLHENEFRMTSLLFLRLSKLSNIEPQHIRAAWLDQSGLALKHGSGKDAEAGPIRLRGTCRIIVSPAQQQSNAKQFSAFGDTNEMKRPRSRVQQQAGPGQPQGCPATSAGIES